MRLNLFINIAGHTPGSQTVNIYRSMIQNFHYCFFLPRSKSCVNPRFQSQCADWNLGFVWKIPMAQYVWRVPLGSIIMGRIVPWQPCPMTPENELNNNKLTFVFKCLPITGAVLLQTHFLYLYTIQQTSREVPLLCTTEPVFRNHLTHVWNLVWTEVKLQALILKPPLVSKDRFSFFPVTALHGEMWVANGDHNFVSTGRINSLATSWWIYIL